MLKPRFVVIASMILAAALARLIPHPWNLTPVAAMALFGGARFNSKAQAALVVFGSLILSDLIIGVYVRMPIVYASFGLILGIGFWLRKQKGLVPVASAVLLGSVSFFLITNFGVWAFGTIYPKTWAGLISCYTIGIPYFRNMLIGDAFYSALLFGSFWVAEKRFPILQYNPSGSRPIKIH